MTTADDGPGGAGTNDPAKRVDEYAHSVWAD
jgi:hypothetical protein